MLNRIRDVIFSFLILLVLSPLILCIVILLIITQKDVFFTQIRAGKEEVPFRMYKFCTLREAINEEEVFLKSRLTPMGRWLREYSLDELPNFINVLKGEMSIVGPRPLYPEYSPFYSPNERKRFQVLPGITGWAQINGRNAISFKKRFELDAWYAVNRSFFLDLKIMFKTPWVMLRSREVYTDDKSLGYRYDGEN